MEILHDARALYCVIGFMTDAVGRWGRSGSQNYTSRPQGAQAKLYQCTTVQTSPCQSMPRGNCLRKERPWGSTHMRFLAGLLKERGQVQAKRP